MTHLANASPPLSRAARAFFVAAAVAPVAACGGPAGDTPTAVPTSFVGTFATGNGMLYPPELWGALEPSMAAAMFHTTALRAIGEQAGWSASPREAFEVLATEMTAPEAAFALADSGLLNGAPPWTTTDIETWWDEARRTADVDMLAKILRLAEDAGTAADLPVDDDLLGVLDAARTGDDIVPARRAAELLATLAPEHLATSDGVATGTNLRHARDAADVLLFAATIERTDPSGVDPLALDLALDAVATDDVVYADVVRSYAASGELDEASRIANLFDRRRVLPDGTVLEPPVFEGTIGSTFRMVRYLAEADRLATDLSDAERTELVRLSRSVLDIDLSHRLAGLSTAALLDPASVSAAERTEAITEALDREVGRGASLDIDRALAWAAVAEHADVLGVPIEFPGLSADAIDVLANEDPANVAFAIAKLLLAIPLDATSHADEVDQLVGLLEAALGAAPAAELDSLTLFGGALAVHHATGRWPVPADVLLNQIATRRGDCRGGFAEFVRDTVTPAAPCNVESTRFANQIATIIEQEDAS